MVKSHLFSICLLACTSFVSMGASAHDYVYGSPVISGDYSLGVYTVGTGDFTDTVSFMLGNSADVTGVTNSLNVTLGTTTFYNIDHLSGELFSGTPTGTHAALTGAGLSFTALGLNTGNYYIQVTGTGTGIGDQFGQAGAYGVGIQVAVPVITSGVPEPETWAMMLAGLGMAGCVIRRKKMDTVSV